MGAREYHKVLEEAMLLDQEEQLRLLVDLAAMVRRSGNGRPHSILELRGMGKEVWEGVDAQEYVDRERASWNG